MMINALTKRLMRRRNAYRAVFAPGPATDDVLADLRRFCRATTTPAVASPQSGTIDPIATGIAIGRLEVWHRIAHHLHISDADLYKIVEQQQEGDE